MHRRPLLALLVLFAAVIPLVTFAGYKDSPPRQPGFTHTPFTGKDDNGSGVAMAGDPIGRGSPTIADIDANPANGKEIVIGGSDGILYAYRPNGTVAWQTQVVAKCAAASTREGIISTAPAVGNLYGDGVPYVVVSYGTVNAYSGCSNGGVAAYDGRNGALKWRYVFNTAGEALHGTMASPGLADVDGNGTLEVGIGTFERYILLLNTNGTLRWRFFNIDTVFSTPAFDDVDGDGNPDMIIGSDISVNAANNTQNGGYVTAFRGSDGAVLWRKFYPQTIYSSPAVADLDGNGSKEIVIGTGCYFSPASLGKYVLILDLRTGTEIRKLNATGCINSAPAIADLDGNGKLDIVAMVDGSATGQGAVEAWQYDNPTAKWRAVPRESNQGLNEKTLVSDLRSPVVADIDGNGSMEVLGVNYNDVFVLNGSNGEQVSSAAASDSKKAMFTWYPLAMTPAVGDLDNNGTLEVVIGGSHLSDSSRGYLFAWTNFAGQFATPRGTAAAYSAPWPMFGGSPLHNGKVNGPNVNVTNTGALVKTGSGRTVVNVYVTGTAGSGWSASDDKDWLSVPSQGTVPSAVPITIDPQAAGRGVHAGTVTIVVEGKSFAVTVKLVVSDTVYDVSIPLSQR